MAGNYLPGGCGRGSRPRRPIWRRWTGPSCVLGFAIAAGVYAHVVTGWPALAGGRDPVARQLFGWNDLAAQAETARQTAHADFIAAEPYGVAAELAWALPAGVDVIGVGSHWASTSLPRARDRRALLAFLFVRNVRWRYNTPEWRDVTRLPDIARAGANGEIERYAVFLVRRAGAMTLGRLLPHR